MIEIRTERPEDFAAVHEMIVRVFDATFGDGEAVASLVGKLRRMPGYEGSLSLVATDGGRVIGHVMFSRVEVVTGAGRMAALALAPLCVEEAYRRQGVGARLARLGMERGRQAGYAAVIVQGNPRYYGRFGFIPCAGRGLVTPFPNPGDPANMVASLDEERFAGLKGEVDYPAPWDAWKTPSKDKLGEMLRTTQFPRSAKYDPQWVIENQMGPHALWLTEWLCEAMDLKPGMRVLDMGCGRAISSVFLAREFGVQVWATDLWVKASENYKRICEAGMADRVFPIHAEARELPYADGFFDAIVCVDSYMYYGTDDLYLQYFAKFVRPGGRIGIVVPGLMREFDGPLPEHLVPFWGEDRWHQDCWSWHTAAWWRQLWSRTKLVDIEVAEPLPDWWRMYVQWKETLTAAGVNRWPRDIGVLKADKGRYIGLVRMVGRRRE